VFVGVGLTPTPLDDEGALWSHIVTTGKNEAGVTARILKQLNITKVKQGALKQLKEENESDYLPLDIAIQQLTEGLTTRTQSRTPKFKAELAAAYLGQIRATGSKGVYDKLAGELDYSPHTLRSYVKELRVEKYLTPAVRGVAGGDLTAKSRKILGLESGA
jgi:hypothetical protein